MNAESILVQIGRTRFQEQNNHVIRFVSDEYANELVNDLNRYPHAFVLACCMDRQTRSELAWMVPYRIKQIFGSFDMSVLAAKSLSDYVRVFSEHNLHRYKEIMAKVFYDAVQRIHTQYGDDASGIWSNSPGSASVVYRFLQFEGVGIKIATMATNILARQFRVPLSDYYSIDVSPDVHVRRVMSRMGLVNTAASNEEIIYKAREINPEFPGIIDFSIWEIGRQWCKSKTPDCPHCSVMTECRFASFDSLGCDNYNDTDQSVFDY